MIEYRKHEVNSDIIKYCFWDYKITLKDLEDFTKSDDWRVKKFAFEKIFCNSNSVLRDLMIFDKDDLFKLIREYKVPQFNHDYLSKRYQIVKHLFLGEGETLEELKWKI